MLSFLWSCIKIILHKKCKIKTKFNTESPREGILYILPMLSTLFKRTALFVPQQYTLCPRTHLLSVTLHSTFIKLCLKVTDARRKRITFWNILIWIEIFEHIHCKINLNCRENIDNKFLHTSRLSVLMINLWVKQ